jgi:hypothetical protein
MKRILVALASLAVALAANLGAASAHPFTDPTPSAEPTPRVANLAPAAVPEKDIEVEQEGDEQDVDVDDADEDDQDEADEGDADEDEAEDDDDDANEATTTGPTTVTAAGRDEHGHHGEHDRDHQRSGESRDDD